MLVLENFAATPQRMRTCQFFLFCHMKTRLFLVIVGPVVSIALECIVVNDLRNNLTNCTNLRLIQCLSLAKAPAYWYLILALPFRKPE